MKENVIYVRQSLGKDKQKLSTDMQKDTCLNYAKTKGFVIHQIYNEGTCSARKNEIRNRPVLVRLMEDVQAGKIKRVVIFKRDRIARKVEQYLEILELFQRHGVELCFGDGKEPPVFNGAIGQLVESLLAGLAQQEAETIVRRLVSSRKGMVQNGKFSGGSKPKWYQSDEEKNLFIPDKDKEFIQLIYKEFLDDTSDNLEVIRKSMKSHPILRTRKFDPVAVIGQEIHRGKLVQTYQGTEVECPDRLDNCRVVPDKIWWEARNKMNSIFPEAYLKKEKKEKKPLPLIYAMVYCKGCGTQLKCGTKLFTCERCKKIKINYEGLEETCCRLALRLLKHTLKSEEIKDQLIEELRKRHLYPLSSEVQSYKKKIKENKEKIKKDIEVWIKHKTKASNLSRELTDYETNLAQLGRLKEKQLKLKERIEAISFSDMLDKNPEPLTDQQKRIILRLITKIEIVPKKRGTSSYPLILYLHKELQKEIEKLGIKKS